MTEQVESKHSQPTKPPSLGILEVEGVRENVAASVLSKDDGSLPARADLTVEAADAGLTKDTVQLWLFWVLATDVADLSTGVQGDEPRLVHRN